MLSIKRVDPELHPEGPREATSHPVTPSTSPPRALSHILGLISASLETTADIEEVPVALRLEAGPLQHLFISL